LHTGTAGNRRPYIDHQGHAHWPLLFVYPETMQIDAVEDSDEQDCLIDHLDAMFSAEALPLQWDTDGAYTRHSIEVYYLSYAAEPLPLVDLAEVSPAKYCCIWVPVLACVCNAMQTVPMSHLMLGLED
jgi:hypothetical protein